MPAFLLFEVYHEHPSSCTLHSPRYPRAANDEHGDRAEGVPTKIFVYNQTNEPRSVGCPTYETMLYQVFASANDIDGRRQASCRVQYTIYASHLRRGCVDDPRWALGIKTNYQTSLLLSQWQQGAGDKLGCTPTLEAIPSRTERWAGSQS